MTTEKVAFITGANRGIGFQTAKDLGKQGITVVIGARDLAKGREAAEKLKAEGIAADAIRFVATDPQTHQEAYDYFNGLYGRLDILVNNAGIMVEDLSAAPNVSKVSPDVLKETFETNFFAVVALTQTLLPLIRKAAAGRIVNLSSILGSLALNSDPASPIGDKKVFAYNASKTALNAFTVHLADELRATNIKVNSAHPGWVKTDMGGTEAPMEIADGSKTSVQLATLPDSGRTGGYVHMSETLPW
ncbi:MAG: short-chain dehydrogenase [Micavibrio sp.]|nr:short-chain dehydrogenase [Micavibrio sp.]